MRLKRQGIDSSKQFAQTCKSGCFSGWNFMREAQLFLEKRTRFVRRYELTFSSRHLGAPPLPPFAAGGQPNLLDAFARVIGTDDGREMQPNTDVVELVRAEKHAGTGALVLLFHRGSSSAADPIFRSRNGADISLRTAGKKPHEEQAVSAHLVIGASAIRVATYSAALEEIPGLSLSTVLPLLRRALHVYPLDFIDRRGDQRETYTTVKAEGIKSSNLKDAMQKGRIGTITLYRPAAPNFAYDDDIKPQMESMKFRIKVVPDKEMMLNHIRNLFRSAKREGWDDMRLEIALEDNRSRTVKIDREAEAAEILFVRSDEVNVDVDLTPCSTAVVPDLIMKVHKLMSGS